jgi:hypothetical protein
MRALTARRAQRDALGALGDALGDVATFMHEAELRRGWLPGAPAGERGVENLRHVGVRLQALRQVRVRISRGRVEVLMACGCRVRVRVRRRRRRKRAQRRWIEDGQDLYFWFTVTL